VGYKVFVPDLPGFGENTPLERAWITEDYIDWIKNFAVNNSLERFFLVGHSFGGGLAAVFSAQFPEQVEKLILVDAAIIRVENLKRELLTQIAKILKLFSFMPFYKSARKFFYKFIASDYPGLEGIMRQTYLNVVKKDLSGCLPAISVPTLLIWGAKDKITPLKDAYLIKDKIPGAKLEIIPNIEHAPYLKVPEILAEKILNFIRL